MSVVGTPSEPAVVVAIDHGQTGGAIPGFEDPEQTLDRVLQGSPDGLIAGIPFLRQFRGRLEDEPDVTSIGTIDITLRSTLPGERGDGEAHRQVFSVEEAARIGCEALKTALVFGRRDLSVLEENLRFIASAAERARAVGLEVVVEPTLWGPLAEDTYDADRLLHANRIGFEIGADILKSPYPGSPEGFEPIVQNAPVPVLIAGGPATESPREALRMIAEAMNAGGAGVMIGRNFWQRENPAAMIRAARAIVHEGATVETALEYLEEPVP